MLGHIDPAAIKHLEKRGLIEVTDTTVASDMRCAVCRECKSQALSYGRGDRSPKAPREVIHTDLEGPFHPGVTGMKYFQVFVDEASPDKRVAGLKTRDAATDATANSTCWKGVQMESHSAVRNKSIWRFCQPLPPSLLTESSGDAKQRSSLLRLQLFQRFPRPRPNIGNINNTLIIIC